MQRNIYNKLNADNNKNGISVRTAGISVLTLRTSVFLAYLSCNRRNSIHNRLFYEQTFFQKSVSKGLNQGKSTKVLLGIKYISSCIVNNITKRQCLLTVPPRVKHVLYIACAAVSKLIYVTSIKGG